MNNDLVVIDNDLIRASYKLTANEMRLVLCALAQIPKDAEVDPKQAYYITKEDFIKLGVEPKNVAREIREACSDLLNRVVTIDTPIGNLSFHWLHNVLHFKSEIFEQLKKQYPNAKNDEKFINTLRLHNLLDSLPIVAKSDDNIVARIVFHENMMPYISQLKKQFTKLKLKEMFGFSSFYSFRIYLMMMQFRETGFCKISIDDLRCALDLNEKYHLFADLKRRVVDTAIDEINEKSPYSVKYELIKKGRTYTHLELRFEEKKTEKGQSKCPKTIDMFCNLTDAQVQKYSSILSKVSDISDLSTFPDYSTFAQWIASILRDPKSVREETAKRIFKALRIHTDFKG